MRKFVIGGGPHTGKTTLLEALRAEMPKDIAHFIPEPAGILIRAELARQAAVKSYTAVLPTNNYPAFVTRAIAKSVELEGEIPADATTTVQDRSLIDNVGYARYHGHSDLVPTIQPHIRAADYAAILLCDFVGTYEQTQFRMGNEEYAHQVHGQLVVAYKESGVPVVSAPPVSVPERVELAMEAMSSF